VCSVVQELFVRSAVKELFVRSAVKELSYWCTLSSSAAAV